MTLAGILVALQGTAYAVYRHQQDTWYKPDREFIRILKSFVPPGSWVATPLRGLAMPMPTYETDCNIFLDVKDAAALKSIIRDERLLYVLVPRPEDAGGFWGSLSQATRERLGVYRLEESAMALLEGAQMKVAGPYDLYYLRPP